MTKQYNTMIPILTTPAGSCLTAKNWQEAGVDRVSYSLASLLIKPGIDYLKTLPDWTHYSGWAGDWVLNASMPEPNASGNYVFRSPYDGARLLCSVADIVDMILHLKPQQVILPEGFYVVSDDVFQALADTTTLLVPISDKSHYPQHLIHGVYYVYDETQPKKILNLIVQHQMEFPKLECYVAGALDFLLMKQLSSAFEKEERLEGKISFESDYPAQDACDGRVYCEKGIIHLQEEIYSMQFERIDSTCHCPTCEQLFTRAYLHHLLGHTPLLCQRLLIQHNAHYCLHAIS